MGNLINGAVFFPPEKSGFFPSDNDYILNTIHGSYIQVKELTSKVNPDIYMILSHGNAETLNNILEWAKEYLLPHLDINYVAYEYTGYSSPQSSIRSTSMNLINEQNSKFYPSEIYTYNDIEAVYLNLVEKRKVPKEKIVAFGRSLGSGPSCYLAEKYNIGGLIIESGFTSILRVVFNLRFSFIFDMYCNINRMANISCKTLIIHCVDDEIVPFKHSLELFTNAKNPYDPIFLNGGSHNTTGIFKESLSQIRLFFLTLYPVLVDVKNKEITLEIGSSKYHNEVASEIFSEIEIKKIIELEKNTTDDSDPNSIMNTNGKINN